ncbi:hypothetical protein [Rheinheimera baltica]|uniref:Uncharacterized protein n=1 Tax=Rheinheimera baltica TaxID=67576 RepID=A0ABT9HVZ8_9GAMM|nr:hypothetical protein [Rheinheimera baltica]MDP5135289.1 hypothetical protein [Rheinheimera baltica]MDP5143954.1 hypothetical protein [Rheinheimera baltica]MDP5191973.1 hypothetical protein [Rheinheimera baltica]
MIKLSVVITTLLLSLSVLAQQQPSTVKLESTISGNQEQPKTIYVLPWQSPVSVIRVPGQSLATEEAVLSPLDRQQFLRFIAIQQGIKPLPALQSVNPKNQ